jgi:ABC-type uncharacterized transport system substrate-binding protein
MSYGVEQVATYRRLADYVAKILKGTKPADLPVEQPTKFEFIVNLSQSEDCQSDWHRTADLSTPARRRGD